MKDLIYQLLEEANKISSEYGMQCHVSFYNHVEYGPSTMLTVYGSEGYSHIWFRCAGEGYEDDLKCFIQDIINNPDDLREVLMKRAENPIYSRS